MNSPKKNFFLNPVVSLPWSTQTKNCENPLNFIWSAKYQSKTVEVSLESKNDRTQNMESLIMRFPGLKKYEAKAALTISNNKLEKAIVLLEVSHSYREIFIQKNCDETAYLHGIRLDLLYDIEEQDPTLRNVTLDTCVNFQKGDAMVSENKENSADSTSDARKQKVGVVLTRTLQGYKATTFEEKC